MKKVFPCTPFKNLWGKKEDIPVKAAAMPFSFFAFFEGVRGNLFFSRKKVSLASLRPRPPIPLAAGKTFWKKFSPAPLSQTFEKRKDIPV
ncbi:MAG: hypothetical protein IJW97_02695, partial [Clostridia bacterium]|nr:hypothetical protein [Clostridia bacterium]